MSYPLSIASQEVVGDPGEITSAVLNAASRGAVVSIADAYELGDGRVSVRLSLDQQAFAGPVSDPNRWTMWHTGVVAACVALGFLIWAVVYLAMVIVAWISENPVLAAVFVVGPMVAILMVAIALTKNCTSGGDSK